MRHQQLLDDFCTYTGLTKTTSTVDCYRAKLRPLLKHWDELNSDQFTRAAFETYLAYGKNTRKWNPRTIVLLIDSSRFFIRWAQDCDLPIPNFTKGIDKPTVPVGKVISAGGVATACACCIGVARQCRVVCQSQWPPRVSCRRTGVPLPPAKLALMLVSQGEVSEQ